MAGTFMFAEFPRVTTVANWRLLDEAEKLFTTCCDATRKARGGPAEPNA
jgi:hypothetical protein